MKVKAGILLLFQIIAFAVFSQPSTLTPIGRQTRNNNVLGYYEYLPPGFDSKDDWPVLVVLHGLGRNGDGSVASLQSKLSNWGIVNWLKSNDVPFVVLIPQDPSDFSGSPTRINSFYGWARGEYINKTTEYNWSVSYNSFSGGAFNAWSKENTELFKSVAAHIPSAAVTGNGTTEQEMNLANSGSSVWFHHSLADNTISYIPSRDFYRGIVGNLSSFDTNKYRYTLYRNVGHGTFNSVVFNDKGLNEPQESGDMGGGGGDYYEWTSGSFWDWLIAQDRSIEFDEVAPVLSDPTSAPSGSITGEGTVLTDDSNGRLYWVVSTNGNTPTAVQIKLGQDQSSSSGADSGNQSVTSSGVQNVSFNGLSPNTTYIVHFLHTDLAGNDSNPVSSGSFTTGDPDYSSVIAGVSVGAPDFTWTLDGSVNEVNGHSTTSSGSMNYAASIVPGITGQSWKSNESASINPENDDRINIDDATEARSISLWFEADNLGGWQNIYEEGGASHGWHIALYDQYLTFTITQDNLARNSIQYPIETNTTYHVVGVFELSDQTSNQNVKLFLNGVLVGSSNFTQQSFLDAHSGDIQFGGTGDGRFLNSDLGNKTATDFSGRIQRIDYWSEKTLTGVDIDDIYILGGKVVIQEPTNIDLDNDEVEDGTPSGSTIGRLSSNATAPITYQLVSGAGAEDNGAFAIRGDELIIEETVDITGKSSYSIRIEGSNRTGSFSKPFVITVQEPPPTAPSSLTLSANSIVDGSGPGTIVGQFASNGTAPVIFTLVDGEGSIDNSSFEIVETHLVLLEEVSFDVKNNYAIRVQASNSAGSLAASFNVDVLPNDTKVNLYVTANDAYSTYGKPLPALTYSYKGFVGGDSPAEVIVSDPVISTNATEESPVGVYPISVSEGQVISKYQLVYEGGELEMFPAELTVIAQDSYINQGDEIPNFELDYDGFVGSDSESNLQMIPSGSTEATNTSAPGDYEITVDGGQSSNYVFSYRSGTLTVGQPCSLVIGIDFDDVDSTLSVEISGGSPPYSIDWFNGSTTNSIDVNGPGEYLVEVYDANDCIRSASIVIDEQFESVLSEISDSKVNVWPNPAKDEVTITAPFKLHSVKIYTLEGRRLISEPLSNTIAVVDLSSLSEGIYTLIINDDLSSRTRIIKRD